MKVAPVSADLLIKLAIGAAVLGAAWYAITKAKNAAAALVDALPPVSAIDPTSRDNVAYHTANKIGDVLTTPDGPGRSADGSWSLGAWVYDVTHGQPQP